MDIRRRILCNLLSTPSLEIVKAFYSQHYPGTQEPIVQVGLQPPRVLTASQATRLKELYLRWDGLSLPVLSTVLGPLRKLEILYLEFSLSYSMSAPEVAMSLDSALQPVAETLRELTILPVDEYEEGSDAPSCMEDLGCRWGPNGLRGFRNLEILRLPGTSFENSGVDSLELPKSLVTLCLSDAYLVRLGTSNSGHAVYSDELRDARALTLDWMTMGRMHYLCRALHQLPRFQNLRVNLDDELDPEELRKDSQPVYVEKEVELLVRVGVKIVVGNYRSNSVALEVRLDPKGRQ